MSKSVMLDYMSESAMLFVLWKSENFPTAEPLKPYQVS